MPSEKRQRQDEARLNKRVAQQTASKRQQRNKGARNIGIIIAVLVIGALGYSLLTGGGDKKDDVTAGGTTTTTSPAAIGNSACPPADGAAARTTTFASGPKACIDLTKTYTATIVTSRGDVVVELDAKAAPKTVNSFVFLARNRYFEGVSFHRIIPGFVVQGGDANGTPPGTGGPGYTVPDELPVKGPPYYEVGSLAMANSGADTNGSQFFIVTGPQGVNLPASYSLFGKVTGGMDVVKAIEATGTEGGTPSAPTTITSVSVIES
jgi:cyclophilin family peptidyl-prolyl cis-trans isomerase